MLVSEKHLRVVPNPFSALDHEGRPAGAVQYDPAHSPYVRHIGATLEQKTVEKRKPGDARGNRTAVSWRFDLTPVDIEDTQFHRERIASGELFAVDESTAKRAGLKTLAPWVDRLKEARDRAIAQWAQDHDGDTPDVTVWPVIETERAPVAPAPPAEDSKQAVTVKTKKGGDA